MDLPHEPSRIFAVVGVLTWMVGHALKYWLDRVRAVQAAGESLDDFVDEHRERLWRLLSQATPFPDAQAKAAELALLLDPVMQAHAYYVQWLPIMRGLAINLDYGATDDPITVALLWRSTARGYRQIGDHRRATRALKNAEGLMCLGSHGEACLDLHMELRQEIGGVRVLQARFDDGERIARQLLDDAHASGDLVTEAHGRTLLAFAYLQMYRPAEAFEQAQQALILWQRLDNPAGQMRTLHYMGEACRLAGDLTSARLYLDATRERLAQSPDDTWTAHLEHSLGALALDEGNIEAALAYLRSARAWFASQGDERNRINSTHALGVALCQACRYDEAEDVLREALAGWEHVGVLLEAANARYALGVACRRNGHPGEAKRALHEALQAARSIPSSKHRERLIRDISRELATL